MRIQGDAVIYMVEMDMRLGDREAEWHAWYLAHIKVLLSVPGFRTSQRFQSILPAPAPYLALHQVDSGDLRKPGIPLARRAGLDRGMARLAPQLAAQPARRA